MLQRLDSSPRISRFIRWLTPALARQRGLPMIVGTTFVFLSCLCFGLIIPGLVFSDKVATPFLWLCLPLGLLYFGLLTALIGFMIATPLGEEFRSTE